MNRPPSRLQTLIPHIRIALALLVALLMVAGLVANTIVGGTTGTIVQFRLWALGALICAFSFQVFYRMGCHAIMSMVAAGFIYLLSTEY